MGDEGHLSTPPVWQNPPCIISSYLYKQSPLAPLVLISKVIILFKVAQPIWNASAQSEYDSHRLIATTVVVIPTTVVFIAGGKSRHPDLLSLQPQIGVWPSSISSYALSASLETSMAAHQKKGKAWRFMGWHVRPRRCFMAGPAGPLKELLRAPS